MELKTKYGHIERMRMSKFPASSARCETVIENTFDYAKTFWADNPNLILDFEINGIEISINSKSKLLMILRDWDLAHYGLIDGPIGPLPRKVTPKLQADAILKFATRKSDAIKILKRLEVGGLMSS